MYYDDETRRFNFLSGLLFGAVLGAGLALLASPQDRVRGGALTARSGRRLKRSASRRMHRLRDDLEGSVSELAATGRRYLRR